MAQTMLKVDNINVYYGNIHAVKNVSFEVNEGEIVALIGPNGAGKTTAFNVITGVYAPTNGRVRFNEACIVRNHPSGKMKKQYRVSTRICTPPSSPRRRRWTTRR